LNWLSRKRTLQAVDDVPVWSISCFYVRRGYRKRGIMAALIGEALKTAKPKARAVEAAYPIDTTRPGSTSNVFTGTASSFGRLGFKIVARCEPSRPVMRHDLKGIAG
jgi:GNAT superfamily N-acetyltransferase